MLNFIICEDDFVVSQTIKRYIEQYLEKNDLTGTIKVYNSDFELLFPVSVCNTITNVFIIDISLNDVSNGLTLAKEIRRYDTKGYIIFITGYLEFALKAYEYKLRALDYIFKGDNDIIRKIFECLDVIRQELLKNQQLIEQNEKILTINLGTNHFRIPFNDILYFETETVERKIILHTFNAQFEFNDTLKCLEAKLDGSFFRCHRSYIINLKQVKAISTKREEMNVILSNDNICLLSPRHYKKLLSLI